MNDTRSHPLRIAIYARFSSTLQQPRSIEDQVRLCQAKARELGGTVVRVHADHAATGTTTQSRPELASLLKDARNGQIDIVVAEALDRISRDQEDIAGIYKRLRYWNVRLVTLQEGDIESIHISIGGLVNQAWLENLAAKTRRGQIGAVHAGRIPGGLSYGYRTANRIEPHGHPLRGLRDIHPAQAEIVRRIYRLYADGVSVREIAARLNADGVPGPRGNSWGQATINGNRARRNGILNNELYRGRLVYGRQRFIRDPDTGKRQARPLPPSDWVIAEVPELRIVDEETWQRVQTRRQAGEDRKGSSASNTPLPLTGVLRCAECGGTMTIVNKRRYACHAHREKGTCGNPRGIDATKIENQVCSLLSHHIADRAELATLLHRAVEQAAERRQKLSDDIDERKHRISRLLDAIETGAQSSAAHRRILEIEQETATMELELQSLPEIPTATPDGFEARLQQRLATLDRAICDPDADPERRTRALLLVKGFIERIDIVPLPGRGRIGIDIEPRIDALVGLALGEDWTFDPGDPATPS